MGFIREKYSNNQGGLTVVFMGDTNTPDYFAGNNIDDALTYFDMYVKNNQMFLRTEEELALKEVGITSRAEAEELRETLDTIVSSYTDDQALASKILFPNWTANVSYQVGDKVRYYGRLYKVLQAHTSQENWTPSSAASLYAPILTNEDDPDTPLPWVQPTSTNPYLTGDKVIYNGAVYQSLIDNNVWAPDDYPAGWQLISSPEPEPEPESEPTQEPEQTIPEWQQPSSGNAYMIGDKVSYNGFVYMSTIDNNVWSPEAYPAGWSLVE